MFLGSILFLVVIFLIVKEKTIHKNHLMGITLSIAMIAFSSIKSFNVSDGIINIERKLEDLKENPEDPKAHQKLEEEVKTISKRPIESPKRLTTLSEANLELGKKKAAESLAKKALEKAPENIQAAEVVSVIEVDKKIKAVKANPKDKKAKAELTAQIKKLKNIPTESGRRTSQIAKGYKVLGNEKMVKIYIDSTKIYQPKHPIIKKYEIKKPLTPKKKGSK
ncbi:MAG TPA: hypothetical protein ENJ53_07970 [Phaeodactylibacter sp.]|nr:hypothetical protein [Phaeodactylibacter sp.]